MELIITHEEKRLFTIGDELEDPLDKPIEPETPAEVEEEDEDNEDFDEDEDDSDLEDEDE